MPATEETYRKTSTLHVVFAVSSIAFLGATVWMIAADHIRPWKKIQREFHLVETTKLGELEKKKQEELLAQHSKELEAVNQKIAQAQATANGNGPLISAKNKEIKSIEGQFADLDTKKRFQKAELDSLRSLYDGMIDRGEDAAARRYIQSTIVPAEKALNEFTVAYQAKSNEFESAKKELKALEGNVDVLVKEKDRLELDVNRVKRTLADKDKVYGEGSIINKMAAVIRGLPGLDVAAPPQRIQQISLPELTINYNFKEVPRYDRCTTCHQAMDKLGYAHSDPGNDKLKPEFHSHPHLTSGATAIDPKGNVVKAGLYLDANGPHPINKFGCTVCHGGQGSGTDFTYSSHEPADLHEKHEWEEKHNWKEMHHWDFPMLPTRFTESSCVKCHTQVTDIPQAKKLQAGYNRITKYGCTGCHQIGGDGSTSPDMTDNRPVGPNLKHISSKATKDWTAKWIKAPHTFRPDTRMPAFYGVTNNSAKVDQPKSHAEIHAITAFLYSKSTKPEGFQDVKAAGNAETGKNLFMQKGCVACHAHKEFPADKFPKPVQGYVAADYGPNLSNISAKFPDAKTGEGWLANWIHAPEKYHPQTLMPNLQISLEDSANIAAWLLTVKSDVPKTFEELPPVSDPEVGKALDELVTLYKRKGGVSLVDLPTTVGKMSTDEKLVYLGEKSVSRLGCFGCHTITGYENAKPIGTPLNGWGSKSPAKLDFAHINEYLIDQTEEHGKRDGTGEYYGEKLSEHTRMGFLYQKLHRPRSYDYKKTNENLKDWDDRLRMPQFTWANDDAAVEEVMTFVLGLVEDKINSKFLPKYTPQKVALAQGQKLIDRYNCKGCHVLEMPKYTITAGTKFSDVLPDLETNVSVSYGARATDYKNLIKDPKLAFDPDKQPTVDLEAKAGQDVTIEGMMLFDSTLPAEEPQTIQVWQPVTIGGHTFQVGDNISMKLDKVKQEPAIGGDFAWIFTAWNHAENGVEYLSQWNRMPPPLLREGQKVQTPWLTAFLKDPYPIRPAANLRMPKFHYNPKRSETAELANYFAAKDGAEFPYQAIPQRDQAYLATQEKAHANYLAGGWNMMTKGACIQCHTVGKNIPAGAVNNVNGPNLRQVNNRFRPEYLEQWIAKPTRILPYTAMPQNIPPAGPDGPGTPKTLVGKTSGQVTALRDALLNYSAAIEQSMVAEGGPVTAPAAPAAQPVAKPAAGGE